MNERGDLRAASRAFIAAAFEVLSVEHVIPTPASHSYIAVGQDYFGGSIMGLPEYRTLEVLLNDAYPERFAEPLKRQHSEFASTYIFDFLEASVARCSHDGRFDAETPAVDGCIDELLSVLSTSSYEVVCCRHVSHLTTINGDEVRIGDVTVIPEQSNSGVHHDLPQRIADEIPGAAGLLNRERPYAYAPPHSLVITREVTSDPNPYEVDKRLSRRLERFLLLVRLLTAGTVQSSYQVSGTTTLISRMEPQLGTFRRGWFDLRVRRTVRLRDDEAAAFVALGEMIDAADVKREGMSATSFDVALGKYNESHYTDSPYEHLVDLATALEAALIGAEKETDAVTLRLRTRVAALLAGPDDPARALFADVGSLYGPALEARPRRADHAEGTEQDHREHLDGTFGCRRASVRRGGRLCRRPHA
jgi:hypothetical protein